MWNGLPLYETDAIDALKARFVELCARYNVDMSLGEFSDVANTPYAIGQYVFANHPGCIDPSPRGGQCGLAWAKDIEILERIRLFKLKGSANPTGSSEAELYERAMQIADDPRNEAKDRIAALTLAAKLKGDLKKEQERGAWGGGGGGGNTPDMLAGLAKMLPN